MQQYTISTILIVAVIASGMGFGIARIIDDERQTLLPLTDTQTMIESTGSTEFSEERRISQAPPVDTIPTEPAFPSGEEWIAKALTLDPAQPDPNAIRDLVLALQAEPNLRYQLMQRFGIESDLRTRQLIINALTSTPTEDVVDFSIQLIGSSDTEQQKSGLALLSAMPPSTTTHQLVKNIVAQEQDPDILSYAISAMMPSMEIPPVETQATVTQLSQLTQHGNASVRARSLEMLALWDKTGKNTEDVAVQAFNDTAPEMRRAAINATIMGQLHSDRLKTNLLGMLDNVNEEREMKVGVLQALERFALNSEEYATYNRIRQEVSGLHFNEPSAKVKN